MNFNNKLINRSILGRIDTRSLMSISDLKLDYDLKIGGYQFLPNTPFKTILKRLTTELNTLISAPAGGYTELYQPNGTLIVEGGTIDAIYSTDSLPTYGNTDEGWFDNNNSKGIATSNGTTQMGWLEVTPTYQVLGNTKDQWGDLYSTMYVSTSSAQLNTYTATGFSKGVWEVPNKGTVLISCGAVPSDRTPSISLDSNNSGSGMGLTLTKTGGYQITFKLNDTGIQFSHSGGGGGTAWYLPTTTAPSTLSGVRNSLIWHQIQKAKSEYLFDL